MSRGLSLHGRRIARHHFGRYSGRLRKLPSLRRLVRRRRLRRENTLPSRDVAIIERVADRRLERRVVRLPVSYGIVNCLVQVHGLEPPPFAPNARDLLLGRVRHATLFQAVHDLPTVSIGNRLSERRLRTFRDRLIVPTAGPPRGSLTLRHHLVEDLLPLIEGRLALQLLLEVLHCLHRLRIELTHCRRFSLNPQRAVSGCELIVEGGRIALRTWCVELCLQVDQRAPLARRQRREVHAKILLRK